MVAIIRGNQLPEALTMINTHWHSLQPADLPALEALDRACLRSDGPASVPLPSYKDLLAAGVPTLCATSDNGEIAALGWLQPSQAEVKIGGKVHPDYRRRGLGTQLLVWAEAQAAHADRLIIRNEAFTEASAALYAQQGFKQDFVENWMQRSLHESIPAVASISRYENWTAHNSRQFFEVYEDAFKERPGFPGISADEWISDNVDDPDFRPDLSLLAFAEQDAVGFITVGKSTIADLDQTVGWISQVGVRPAWRGRGIAAGLIAATMAACIREGYPAVGLHVNANNPAAIRVYEHLGFKQMGQRAKYSKNIRRAPTP